MTETHDSRGLSRPSPAGPAGPTAIAPTDPSGRAIAFLSRLSDADRQLLLSQASREHFASGEVICREGEYGDTLYFVEAGQVAVVKEVGNDYPMLLCYRGAGESIGEMSFVGQQPRSASVIAVEDTLLLSVSVDNFQALLNDNPGFSWAILNVLNDRLYEADVARSRLLLEEQEMTERLTHLTGETERLAKVARVRKETVELIAHDVRTPVTVIEGCLQMLRSSLPDQDQESTTQILDLAQRSTKRLMALLKELLIEARQDALFATQPHHSVDLVQLLQKAVEAASITAQQSNLQIDLQIPADLPQPTGDSVQIERVMANLLDNAMSYTPAGGNIVVSAIQRPEEIEVTVTDTGPGIPPEQREQIFERFSQVPGMQRTREGFGLGLYFCRRVVQAHGGRIWVEAGPEGRGSRFAFSIPLDVGTDRA